MQRAGLERRRVGLVGAVVARLQLVDAGAVDVEADDAGVLLREGEGDGEPDVAQADDCDGLANSSHRAPKLVDRAVDRAGRQLEAPAGRLPLLEHVGGDGRVERPVNPPIERR